MPTPALAAAGWTVPGSPPGPQPPVINRVLTAAPAQANHRLVFLTKLKTVATTADYLSFPLEMVEGLEAARVLLVSPAVRFRVQGREYTFTFLQNAGEVVEAVTSASQSAPAAGESRPER
jgi:hypothetical protein